MKAYFSLSLTFLYFFLNPLLISASAGDWIPEQIQCKYHCEKNYCLKTEPPLDEDVDILINPPFIPSKQSVTPNFIDVFLLWDCQSLCDYQCQQLTTNMLQEKIATTDLKTQKEQELEIEQFHGKWPFVRIAYIQEFWSTVFSLGNFIPHFTALSKLNKNQNIYSKSNSNNNNNKSNNNDLLINNYKLVALMGCCAWISSFIFHFRDLIVTEKLDYFFAGATVLSGFYAISVRVFVGGDKRKQTKYGKLAFSLCALIFMAHILRLYFDWSYTYNMRFNIFFGVLQYIMLITVGISNYFKYKGNKYLNVFKLSFTPIFLVFFTGLSMSFELFDIFIPSLQIDSHALWHCMTIWPSFKLYDFFIEDHKALMSSQKEGNLSDTTDDLKRK